MASFLLGDFTHALSPCLSRHPWQSVKSKASNPACLNRCGNSLFRTPNPSRCPATPLTGSMYSQSVIRRHSPNGFSAHRLRPMFELRSRIQKPMSWNQGGTLGYEQKMTGSTLQKDAYSDPVTKSFYVSTESVPTNHSGFVPFAFFALKSLVGQATSTSSRFKRLRPIIR